LLVGLVVTYAAIMTAVTRGASGTAQVARTLQERQALRRAERAAAAAEAEAYAHSIPAMPDVLDAAEDAPERPGLLARMPTLIKRAEPVPDAMPEPELVEAPQAPDMQAPSDERISAKITDVIKARVRSNPAVRIEAVAPLTKGRGRGPVPLIADTAPRVGLPPEPPLTAGAMVAAPEPLLEEDDDMALFEAPEPVMPEPAPRIPTPEPRKVVQQPVRKLMQPSTQAKAEAQPKLRFEDTHPGFELPPLNLLENPVAIERHHLSDEALEENARMLENVLDDYGVKGEIVSVRPGPVVTMYELEPAPGLKASRVIGLSDDIARSMAALSARVSTVPGRSVIGIELPNENREKVLLREILAARDFGDSTMKLPLALGKDIGGDAVVANLAKMPHLLIAGTTGSGKSVAINTMILSLLYRLTPEQCRLIMIDPKMLELSVYDGIPHLLSPVVTDPKKAVVALKWVVGEMEERYRKMSKMGVRNIDGYNGRVRDALAKGEMFSRTVQTGFDDDTGDPIFETEEFAPEAMPYIVVIVDEMADLMMVAGKEIEACIQRLAQMARASGIHLIMATQRPSVDVITGTIKANFPTRISFQVTSKIDSRTILGEMGAEQLLGMGDMLYMAGGAKITRCHGPFVSDEEVEEIVNHLKAFGAPDYVSGVVEGPDEDKESGIDAVLGLGGNTDGEDALYDQAVAIVIKDRKCSTSYIQRKLAIGYNKAARLVEQMEDEGVVSSANHVGKREILVPEQ
ncbi:MAG: DNA translocase FtsK, partial [Pseudomonadota bacterium]